MTELDELRELLAALTDNCEPGPWHAVVRAHVATYGWWLENAAKDSSYPEPKDVALMVNALPVLLAEVGRLESALEREMDAGNAALAEVDRLTKQDHRWAATMARGLERVRIAEGVRELHDRRCDCGNPGHGRFCQAEWCAAVLSLVGADPVLRKGDGA